MASSDPLAQLQDGLVATVDAAAAVIAVTVRDRANLIPWAGDFPTQLPVATYVVSVLEERVGGYTASVQLAAWADDALTAQALLHAVCVSLNQPALQAAGCDAVVLQEIRREIPSEERTDPARADADLIIFFTPV
jgi:hypothetical protein